VTWDRFVRRVRAELRLTGQAAWRGLDQLVNGSDLTHAAAIAYYALLSLFPILLLLISILGTLASGSAPEDEAARTAVLTFVLRYFPTRIDFVTTQLDALGDVGSRVGGGVVGVLALIWAALGVFGAITSAVNEAWGVEKQRSFWKHRLVSFLMLVAAGVVTVVAFLSVTATNLARGFIQMQIDRGSLFGDVVSRAGWLVRLQTLTFDYLATILLILGVGLVFYFIPNARTRFRDVWVGAVLTGVLWRLAFDGFSWYVEHNSRLTQIHGSIATVVVFLLWIYISAIILMYGVEFTAGYARLRRRRPEQMPAASSPRTYD
jgi:membrane protein